MNSHADTPGIREAVPWIVAGDTGEGVVLGEVWIPEKPFPQGHPFLNQGVIPGQVGDGKRCGHFKTVRGEGFREVDGFYGLWFFRNVGMGDKGANPEKAGQIGA